MFRRLKSSFTGGSKGSTKVLFTVRIASLTGLTPGASCRVVWARQAKVQVTSPAIAAHNGSAQWPGEDLSLVSTMEADGKGSYAPKEFVFKVQQEERGGKFVTLGKLSLDLSPCVGAGSGKPMGRDVRVPLGARPRAARGVATMSLVVSAEVVRKGGGSDSEGEEGEDDLASEGSDISSVHEFSTPRPSSPMRATPPQPLAAVTLALPPERKAAAATAGVGTAALLGGVSGAATTGASAGEETVENTVDSANHPKEEKPRGLDSQATGADSSSTGAPPSPPSSSAEARQLRADLLAVQEELSAARAAAAEAEARAARAESDAGQAASRAESSAAQAAKQEARIAQLLAAVEARGEGKSELEERLLAAETELGEAEALANEAMSLLESAQNEAAELREALEGARHDASFATEQASRERSGWEARLKEAFRRVEGAVALAERAAEERDDLAARLEAAERRAAELERAAEGAGAAGAAALAGAAVAAESTGASVAALQAELESAHLRLKAMEEAVERADAERAEARAALLRERSAAAAAAPEQDGLPPATSPTAAADEAVDALRLELQFAQQESARLRGELEGAARELQATVDMHGEEARALRARCAELGAQLQEARGSLAQAKGLVAEHEARVRVLEASAGVGAAAAVAASPPPPQVSAAPLASPLAAAAGRSLPQQQQAPSSPPTQPAVLDVLNGELTSLSAAMVGLTTERDALESRLRDVETEFAAQQAALQLAQQRLESREARLAALERASAGGSTRPASATTSEDDEIAAARNLAAFSSAELASAVTSLAEAQAERADLAAKLAELRGEVSTLRRSNEGELRGRLEALERDLLVARNRADVNELFREEHDRLASDLVQTKLVWAEGQETLVKLRRQLVKSQEKSMSFASKLTRLETKLYARVKSTMKDLKQKATPRDRHA